MISLFSRSLCGNLFSWHCVLATLPPCSFLPPTPFSKCQYSCPCDCTSSAFPRVNNDCHVTKPTLCACHQSSLIHSLTLASVLLHPPGFPSPSGLLFFICRNKDIPIFIGFLPLRLSYLNLSVISLGDLILSCRSLLGLP